MILTGKLGNSFRYGNFAAAITGVADIRSVSQPGVVDSMADSMRNGLREALMGIDPRSGSLVSGLAIGDESAMPDQLRDQMRTPDWRTSQQFLVETSQLFWHLLLDCA